MIGGFEIRLALLGKLKDYYEDTYAAVERGTTAGIREETLDLKGGLRSAIKAGGFAGTGGDRIGKTVRSDIYPRAGASASAAGLVWSKAPHLIDAFDDDGAIVKAKSGRYVAIPTENAPKRSGRKRITPRLFERMWPTDLDFVPAIPGRRPAMLVALARPRTGKRGGFSAPSDSALGLKRAGKRGRSRAGIGLVTVPMFWLVPAVRLRSRFRIKPLADRAQSRLPATVARHIAMEIDRVDKD